MLLPQPCLRHRERWQLLLLPVELGHDHSTLLQGAPGDVSKWGHEYIRHLAGEGTVEMLRLLACDLEAWARGCTSRHGMAWTQHDITQAWHEANGGHVASIAMLLHKPVTIVAAWCCCAGKIGQEHELQTAISPSWLAHVPNEWLLPLDPLLQARLARSMRSGGQRSSQSTT